MDTAALLILRALAGKAGKVEIGSRQYTFSCIPTFQLRDDMTGRIHRCPDSAGLYRTIVSLSRGGTLPRAPGWKRS